MAVFLFGGIWVVDIILIAVDRVGVGLGIDLEEFV